MCLRSFHEKDEGYKYAAPNCYPKVITKVRRGLRVLLAKLTVSLDTCSNIEGILKCVNHINIGLETIFYVITIPLWLYSTYR